MPAGLANHLGVNLCVVYTPVYTIDDECKSTVQAIYIYTRSQHPERRDANLWGPLNMYVLVTIAYFSKVNKMFFSDTLI